MNAKDKVVFDINSEKFRYLKRGNNKINKVVDIDVLNKRLNEVKKLNFYSNAKMIFYALFTVGVFVLISLNF
jgi:hypothetical protein